MGAASRYAQYYNFDAAAAIPISPKVDRRNEPSLAYSELIRLSIKVVVLGMRRLLATLVLIGIAAAAYAWFVRGLGVPTAVPAPQRLTRGDRAVTYSWRVLPNLPTPRSEVAAAELGGRLYVIGGLDGLGRASAAVEVYDPASGSWSQGPRLPDGRHHAAAAALGGRLYVVGGFSGLTFRPHAEVYSLATTSSAWVSRAPLPAARGALTAVAIDGKLYAYGGVEARGVTGALTVYDPRTDRWLTATSSPTIREHHAAAALGGKLYVAGGRQVGISHNFSSLEIYDPTRGTWSSGPPMLTARGGVAGAAFDGLFAVAGGEQPSGTFAQVEAFDPAAGRWQALPSLPTPRHGLGVVSVGDSLYALAGGKRPGLSVSGSIEVLEAR